MPDTGHLDLQNVQHRNKPFSGLTRIQKTEIFGSNYQTSPFDRCESDRVIESAVNKSTKCWLICDLKDSRKVS